MPRLKQTVIKMPSAVSDMDLPATEFSTLAQLADATIQFYTASRSYVGPVRNGSLRIGRTLALPVAPQSRLLRFAICSRTW